jgi:hypothetical protein
VFYFGFFIIILPLTSIFEQIITTDIVSNYWAGYEEEVKRQEEALKRLEEDVERLYKK